MSTEKSQPFTTERIASSTGKGSGTQLLITQYHDFWMDNAIENLYCLVKNLCDADPSIASYELTSHSLLVKVLDDKKFLQSFKQLLVSKRDSVLFTETIGKHISKKNVKLGYILPQYAKSSNGRNSVKEKIYIEDEMIGRLSAGLWPKAGERICVLCGSNFQKRIDNLKQSVLPSVTRNAALSGTLLKDDYFRSICPTCYMLGALEWVDDRIIYRSQQDGESIALYPIISDLTVLYKEKQIAYQYLKVRALDSNLHSRSKEGEDIKIYGPYSAIVFFLEAAIGSVSRRIGGIFDSEAEKMFALNKWMCLRVPSGNVKNVKIEEIALPDRILETIGGTKSIPLTGAKVLKLYSGLFHYFRLNSDVRSGGMSLWKEQGELREKLSKAFINDDFHAFSGLFLRRKGVNVYLVTSKWPQLDYFLSAWQLNEAGISSYELEKIKQAANLVAELNLKSVAVFYNMERARSISEFITAMQEATRKLIVRADDFASGNMRVHPTSLESFLDLITGSPARWRIIRDTLLIYTSMYFAIKKRGEQRD